MSPRHGEPPPRIRHVAWHTLRARSGVAANLRCWAKSSFFSCILWNLSSLGKRVVAVVFLSCRSSSTTEAEPVVAPACSESVCHRRRSVIVSSVAACMMCWATFAYLVVVS